MRKLILKAIYIYVFLCLIGCHGVGLSSEHIIGPYYLIAMDYDKDNTSLCIDLDNNGGYRGIVTPNVFAIGYNHDYIIAKQHADTLPKITNYFIVPIFEEYNSKLFDYVIGPLDINQFNKKRKELNIEDITFKDAW